MLDIECKMTILNSFILSNFIYCSVVWHFCNGTDTHKMEKIREKALRFTYNNYESIYDDVLQMA